jgi:hypothetical protein
MKPQLPIEIVALLPPGIVEQIYKFVPHLKKVKERSPHWATLSPKAETELRMIQYSTLKGRCGMYMRDLEDFLLDR